MALFAFVVSLLVAGLATPTAAQAVPTSGPVAQECLRYYDDWEYLGISHPNFTGDIGIRTITTNCDGDFTFAIDCSSTAKRKNNISENVRFAVFNSVNHVGIDQWWGGLFPAAGTRRTWAVDVGDYRPGAFYCEIYTETGTLIAETYDVFL